MGVSEMVQMPQFWIAALAFSMFGGAVGVLVMCIVQAGHDYIEDDFGRDRVDVGAPPEKQTGTYQLSFAAPPSPALGNRRLLTAKQCARRLGMSERWVYDHSPEFPFTVRTGRRSVRFDSVRLGEYMAERKASGKA